MGFGQLALGLLVLLFLLGFCVLGVLCIFNPDWGMKHFGPAHLREGGQMRQEMNRLQFRLMGVVFSVVALYILFHFLHD